MKGSQNPNKPRLPGKSPKPEADYTGYGPDIHQALDQIPFPNDESNYSLNYSPGNFTSAAGAPTSNAQTPAPHVPVGSSLLLMPF